MEEGKAKKESIICALRVLQMHSSKDHPLKQKEIIDLMQRDYGAKIGRHALKSNLEMLLNLGFKLRTGEGEHLDEDGKYTSIYLEPEFEDKELRLLINIVSSSRFVPTADARRITDKLKSLTSSYFKSAGSSLDAVIKDKGSSLMDNMDKLHSAILDEKQVEFEYCSYGADGRLHPKTLPDGSVKKYTISPYRVVEMNGRFYLICHNPLREGIVNFRVDKIININQLNEHIVSPRKFRGLTAGLNDLPRYLAEHINMSFGETRFVIFDCRRNFLNVVMDTFLPELVKVEKDMGETCRCRIKIDADAMATWAMQYPEQIRVIDPPEVVEKIRENFRKGAAAYAE